jgi:hypothetical protein
MARAKKDIATPASLSELLDQAETLCAKTPDRKVPAAKVTRAAKAAATKAHNAAESAELACYNIEELFNEVPAPTASTVSNAQLLASAAAGAIVAGRGFRRFFGG